MFLRQLLIILFAGLSLTAFAGELDDLDMVNPRQPMENLIVGGQPSEDDLEYLAEEGYTLVINLRTVGEFDEFDEAEVVEGFGMKYVNIPVYGRSDLSEENARLLHDVLESADGPALLHCTVGMRASGLLGIEGYLFHDLSKDEAMELGIKAHMSHIESYIKDSIEEIEGE